MRGRELTDWRKRNGYDQKALMRELGIRSRQTVSKWENSGEAVPRTVELALIALEKFPECRNIAGHVATSRERRKYFSEIGERNDS